MRSRAVACALTCAFVAVTPGPSAWAAPPDLPAITPTLAEGQRCRQPSTVKTDEPPWAQNTLRPKRAWQHSTGAGVRVAVVDTGVDDEASALRGRVVSAMSDCVGHGTFVAGIIAAAPRGDNGFTGIAPGAEILAVTATDRLGRATADSIAKGIRSAVADGADVVQVSVGVAKPNAALSTAVEKATAAGVLLVAPAVVGDPDEPVASFPAAYREVLSVAATGPDGQPLRTRKGSVRVDLAAPGAAVTSIGPGGNGLFTGSGDALASAHVAAAAALVRGYRPELGPRAVAQRLRATAYPPPGTAPDPLLGDGVIDPTAAVTAEWPKEQADGPHGGTVRPLRMPPPDDVTPKRIAAVVAAGAGALIALVGLAAVVLPRARRRGWRAGS